MDAIEKEADIATFQEAAERFARERIRPRVDAWEAAGAIAPGLYREAAQFGLLGQGDPRRRVARRPPGVRAMPWRRPWRATAPAAV
jgi:hypothetical protein